MDEDLPTVPSSVLLGPRKAAPSFAAYDSRPPMAVAPLAVIRRPMQPAFVARPVVAPVTASAPTLATPPLACVAPRPPPSLAPAVLSGAPTPRSPSALAVLAMVVAFFGGMGTTVGVGLLAMDLPPTPRTARTLGVRASSLTFDGAVAAKQPAAEPPARKRRTRRRPAPANVDAPAPLATPTREPAPPWEPTNEGSAAPNALLPDGLADPGE